MVAAVVAAAFLGGCSVRVPDPAAPDTAPATRQPATPTVSPGHDAGAVAARSMPFSAGSTLARGVPVQLSDGLADAPGWRRAGNGSGGASEYRKSDGCLAAAKVRINQWPLVAGNDRESTEGLFAYLDPTILPKYLTPASLRWGGEPGRQGPTVDVLVLERAAVSKGTTGAVLARVFGKAGSSVFVAISCPTASALTAAKTDVARWLTVVPPAE
ncbi:hypothetical protein SRABI83_00576 [Arthrobacter sp. Bi83]|uniref:hypothetical protein n=1 Tax=Arthrobacter sp. Bi83 TaxID=2822353 RepID=UPI001D84075C|nr:hypothetical protein [Arthrobacter sp. Bi83]CAH0145162.1 hypothetical protein SRABI83_00576 [Arthrobacter sp. Bi83]